MLPFEQRAAFQTGQKFSDIALDSVFTFQDTHDSQIATSIHDPASGRTMVMTLDSSFRQCVIYNPPHREAICIEPYTCAPDPFRLSREGVDTGLRVLAPGQSFAASIQIRVD